MGIYRECCICETPYGCSKETVQLPDPATGEVCEYTVQTFPVFIRPAILEKDFPHFRLPEFISAKRYEISGLHTPWKKTAVLICRPCFTRLKK